MMEKQEKKKI